VTPSLHKLWLFTSDDRDTRGRAARQGMGIAGRPLPAVGTPASRAFVPLPLPTKPSRLGETEKNGAVSMKALARKPRRPEEGRSDSV